MTGILKKIRIYGIMYLIFGCLGAINMLWRIFSGNYSALKLVKSGFFSESFAMFFLILMFAVSAIVILMYFCVGFKGYAYGIGEGYGTIHISVSKYMPIILIVQIVISIIEAFGGTADLISIILAVLGFWHIFGYRKYARIALES